MGIERDAGALAIVPAHDEVGDGFHPGGAYVCSRHRILLRFKAKRLQQLGGALGMRRVVAGGRVGRHANELLQKAHFFVEVRVYPVVQFFVVGA